MSSEKTHAICELVRSALMQPLQLDTIISSFSTQAIIMGKKLKSDQNLISAKEHITSDDFIKQFSSAFERLSKEEIKYLISFFKSEAMKKYTKMSMSMVPIYQAMQEVCLETTDNQDLSIS
ncbi:MAG: hypothetical protein QG627_1149 [Chlamydiota bacterium]|jgi:GTP-sensing pleiotropic transcriptional regulator CodY|nr:hypothetical protein [Chlamydiota bacterium]